MQIKILDEAVDLTSVAAGAAVEMAETPFLYGRQNAVLVISTNAAAGGSLEWKIQGTDDDPTDSPTWTDLATTTAQGPVTLVEVRMYRYMRSNLTVAGSAGTGNAYLMKAND